jgi:pimeloyl-ACP methyl ester carboxylesterase
MPLPPDTRTPLPLPPELPPLTAWAEVEAAAAEAARRFTTPPPITRRITDPSLRPLLRGDWPPRGQFADVETPRGRIATWRWDAGSGAPLVACLHGWGGRGTQFGPMVQVLSAAGFSVMILDGPAHGASDGDRGSMPGFRDALLAALGDQWPAALVGHSLGGLAVLAAAAELSATAGGRSLPRLVSIGAPSCVTRPHARFLLRHEATEAVRAAMVLQMEAAWRFRWHDILTTTMATRVQTAGGAPVLVVHAEDDEQVPVIEATGLVDDWPGAQLLRPTSGGHTALLRDPAVIDAIVQFVGA